MHELTRMVTENPNQAKKKIRDVFARAGYDYENAAKLLGLHHYTLRRHARQLGITERLVRDRDRAKRRGEKKDENGRPPKPIPTKAEIKRAFERNDCNMSQTAKALGVTEPTFRKWRRLYDLSL